MEVLERIKTDTLNEEERTLLDEWESDFIQLAEYKEYLYGPFKEEMAQKHLRDLRQQAVREALEEVREEVAKEVREEVAKEVREEVAKEVREEVREEVEMTKEQTVLSAHQQGLDNALIATITQLSFERVKEIIEKNKGIKGV